MYLITENKLLELTYNQCLTIAVNSLARRAL